ncbi:MAG: hypothetical protein WCB26_12715, partial [Pseudolabrys sp.]
PEEWATLPFFGVLSGQDNLEALIIHQTGHFYGWAECPPTLPIFPNSIFTVDGAGRSWFARGIKAVESRQETPS